MFHRKGWLTVRTSGSASVGIVTELVDVHAAFRIGVVASDIPCDGGRRGLGSLLEGNGSGDLRVTSESCNYNDRRPTWSARDSNPEVARRQEPATESAKTNLIDMREEEFRVAIRVTA